LVLTTIVAISLITISCCPSATSTPTGTVNAYLDAQEAQDVQATVDCFVENYLGSTTAEFTALWEDIFESIESFAAFNRKIEIKNQTETTALIIASWSQYIVYTDGTIINHPGYMGGDLIKVGGKWLFGEPPPQ
jgi:hypothetical protein